MERHRDTRSFTNEERSKKRKVIIAGGGTGGHVYPALALAAAFRKRDAEVLFVGTRRGMESQAVPRRGFAIDFINVRGLKGKGMWETMKNASLLPRSFIQSVRLLRRFRPDVVIGVGGYASGPAVMAAILMDRATAIAEQNAVSGFTNRILGRFVDAVFVTFAVTARDFPRYKVRVTGNPVRREFYEHETAVTRDGDRFGILVFGGSQGARRLNHAVTDALGDIRDLFPRLRITHQTGGHDERWVKDAYDAHGVDATVTSFIDDMANAFRRADLVICRAGATTVAELAAAGKAAVLVPYPHAVGDHQRLNARVLADAGAAVMLRDDEIDGPVIARVIRNFADDPGRSVEMGKAAARLGNPRAADDMVDECLALIERKGR